MAGEVEDLLYYRVHNIGVTQHYVFSSREHDRGYVCSGFLSNCNVKEELQSVIKKKISSYSICIKTLTSLGIQRCHHLCHFFADLWVLCAMILLVESRL